MERPARVVTTSGYFGTRSGRPGFADSAEAPAAGPSLPTSAGCRRIRFRAGELAPMTSQVSSRGRDAAKAKGAARRQRALGHIDRNAPGVQKEWTCTPMARMYPLLPRGVGKQPHADRLIGAWVAGTANDVRHTRRTTIDRSSIAIDCCTILERGGTRGRRRRDTPDRQGLRGACRLDRPQPGPAARVGADRGAAW
jgi:hypothetical protein